ncbi:hypothetical protein FOL46_002064, partial [Perkinsus olseni]
MPLSSRRHRELTPREVEDRVKQIIDSGGASPRGRQSAKVVALVEKWRRGEPIKIGKFLYQRGKERAPYVNPNPSIFILSAGSSSRNSTSAENSTTPKEVPNEGKAGVPGDGSSHSSQDDVAESGHDSEGYDALGSTSGPPTPPQTADCSGEAQVSDAQPGKDNPQVPLKQAIVPWSSQETLGCGTCPKYQCDFVLGAINRKATPTTFNGWVRAEYPSMDTVPNLDKYLLKDTYIFNPLSGFGAVLGPRSLMCPMCKSAALKCTGLSSHGPRLCTDLRRDYWVWPVVLACTGVCGKSLQSGRKRFFSLAEEIMNVLPQEIRRSLPFVPFGTG